MKKPKPVQRFVLYFPAQDHARAKLVAQSKGMTLSVWIRALMAPSLTDSKTKGDKGSCPKRGRAAWMEVPQVGLMLKVHGCVSRLPQRGTVKDNPNESGEGGK